MEWKHATHRRCRFGTTFDCPVFDRSWRADRRHKQTRVDTPNGCGRSILRERQKGVPGSSGHPQEGAREASAYATLEHILQRELQNSGVRRALNFAEVRVAA